MTGGQTPAGGAALPDCAISGAGGCGAVACGPAAAAALALVAVRGCGLCGALAAEGGRVEAEGGSLARCGDAGLQVRASGMGM